MTFERLGPIVERVVSRLVNEVAGEGSVAAEPNAEIAKKGPDRSPAKFQGDFVPSDTTLPANKIDTSRRMAVTPPNGLPRPVAAIRLVVNNGDRPERREEQASGRSIAQARGGNLASNLVVIEGGRRHWTASAF